MTSWNTLAEYQQLVATQLLKTFGADKFCECEGEDVLTIFPPKCEKCRLHIHPRKWLTK